MLTGCTKRYIGKLLLALSSSDQAAIRFEDWITDSRKADCNNRQN